MRFYYVVLLLLLSWSNNKVLATEDASAILPTSSLEIKEIKSSRNDTIGVSKTQVSISSNLTNNSIALKTTTLAPQVTEKSAVEQEHNR